MLFKIALLTLCRQPFPVCIGCEIASGAHGGGRAGRRRGGPTGPTLCLSAAYAKQVHVRVHVRACARVLAGWDRTGQRRTWQDRAGQDRTGQGKTG